MKVMWAVATVLAAATPQAPAEPLSWDRYQHLTGVFDVAGPLPGGRLVVAGSQQLVALDPATNQVATFGPEGGQGGEAYVTVSPTPALRVNGAGCSFAPGGVYQLRVSGSPAVTRIDPQGGAHPFAQVSGFDSLNGISFDTSGRFGHRLTSPDPAGRRLTPASRGGCEAFSAASMITPGGRR